MPPNYNLPTPNTPGSTLALAGALDLKSPNFEDCPKLVHSDMSWDVQHAFATTLARDESVTPATIDPETTNAFFKFIACDALASFIRDCLEHKPCSRRSRVAAVLYH